MNSAQQPQFIFNQCELKSGLVKYGRHSWCESIQASTSTSMGTDRRTKTDRGRDAQKADRDTQLFNFGVVSQPYWETVHSELSTEIRYWSFQPPPLLSSSFPHCSPFHLPLPSYGTAYIPFWGSILFHLVLLLFLSLFLPLWRFLSIGITVVYASLVCIRIWGNI